LSAAWSVEFYEDHRGHKPALEFIEGLPPKEAAAVLRAMDLLEEHGTALREPYAKHMRGAIWELRAGAGRVF
jgi:phage-related protein